LQKGKLQYGSSVQFLDREMQAMPRFRLVSGDKAGPEALGILVPPGRRTLVILRPRSLNCDLLLLSPLANGAGVIRYWEIAQDQASLMSHKLQKALAEGTAEGEEPVRAVSARDVGGYHLCAVFGGFRLVVCRRVPGAPYQALRFATLAEAQQQAVALARVLWPDPEANQEVYFNARHFLRQV
jgi:hypothetical protein